MASTWMSYTDTARCDEGPLDSRLNQAIAGGVDFLLRTQDTSGCWYDFDLDVGPSTSWTTALVLLNLKRAANFSHCHLSPSAVNRACVFLASTQRPETFGWGYNESVRADCDSTSLAILALRAAHCEIDERSLSFVLRHESRFGHFRTFAASGQRPSWSTPHLEVGAMAALALEDLSRASAVADEYRRDMTRFGRVSSFWWDTPAYPLYAVSWLLHELPVTGSMLVRTSCSSQHSGFRHQLDAALLGLASLYLTQLDAAYSAATYLVTRQRPDGSWGPSQCLRYSDGDCLNEWLTCRTARGLLHADDRRILSTSFAVRFLAELLGPSIGGSFA